MLSVNSYTKDYIDHCRSNIESQLAAYNDLIKIASGNTAAGKSALNSALDSFEPLFFNNLVLVLDSFFVHRSRTLEGKDGNLMNEVRMICNSILEGNGVMSANKTIKYNASKSILKLEIGKEIKLRESGFVLLFRAFFAEIEATFTA